uniref:Dynein axonemal intermediate chain 4 n=1 Tax=Halisarca dujardinii TaxID=2583056 RepID=A0A9F1U410_HALDU|nr:axonemal dynein intermediate chain 4 [Halisarca dujardinii]
MQKRGREKNSVKRSQHDQSFAKSRPSSMKSVAGTTRSYVSSRVSFTSSRRNLAAESSKQLNKANWQILDETGVDVTPQPLLQLDVHAIKMTQSNLGSDKDSSTVSAAMQQSLFGQSFALPGGTSATQGPFSSSVFGSISDIGTTGGSITRSFTEEQPRVKRPTESEEFLEERTRTSITLTESDLEKPVSLTLSETETIWLLDMDSVVVAKGSEDTVSIQEQNELYQQLVNGREGNDRYVPRGVQTVDFDHKIKGSQTMPVDKKSTGAWATVWDIYDTYKDQEEGQEPGHPAASGNTSTAMSGATSASGVRVGAGGDHRNTSISSKSLHQTLNLGERAAGQNSTPSMMIGNESSMVSTMGGRLMAVDSQTHEDLPDQMEHLDPTQPNDHSVLRMASLAENLLKMEKAVLQNVYQEKQAMYRGLPVLKDPFAPVTSAERQFVIHKPHLERLWTLSYHKTKDKQASCMAWNKQNPDIVAVGYGNLDFSGQEDGIVCCWSLKNPEHPERVYKATSPITSLSFSDTHANLLAAGHYDGNVSLYNLRVTEPDCILDTRDNCNSHYGPVWQVEWVEKERSMAEDRTEVLVTIGSDGRVNQWSIRKGFEGVQLMRIKRPAHLDTRSTQQSKAKGKHSQGPAAQEGVSKAHSSEALISQYTTGLAFDFWPDDVNIYVASTQEGLVHKCSCSYNEQFLETYEGHTGPVMKVKWCPYQPSNLFITCSADWSVKIWHQDESAPLLSLTSAQCHKSIVDVCWCPWNVLVFATVSTGRIELWDLSYSILDPYIVHKLSGNVQQCCLRFGMNAKVLLVGDAKGTVSVYQMKNVSEPPPIEESMSSLMAAISKEL